MPLFNKRNNTKQKPSKGKIAVRAGIGALAVAAALSLVGKSMEKSKLDQLARMGESKAKTNLVAKAASIPTLKSAYPQVTDIQLKKEQGQIRKILELKVTNETDRMVESSILKIAKASGVSPRVALRTLARSDGRSSALNPAIDKLKYELNMAQIRGDLKSAQYLFSEMEEKQKIQLILRNFEAMDEQSRGKFRARIKGY